VAALLFAVKVAEAAPLTPGNLIVSQSNMLFEYTPAGVYVQSFSVPYPVLPRPAGERVRDIIPGSLTEINIYDGTFDPYLNTVDLVSMSWSSQTYAGWSTGNNVSFGGIARVGTCVFVTDMDTAGDSPSGIVRFQLADGTATRFFTAPFIDVTTGYDGLLYALLDDGVTVRVFDPSSLALAKTITLSNLCLGIAVNAAGHVFGASWDGNIYHFGPGGALLGSISGASNLIDIDLASDGAIVVGGRFGDVILTDESLSSKTSFTLQSTPTFVAFSAPPPITASGVCAPDKSLGEACAGDANCQSGFCVDGVCCNTACNAGPCDACSAAAGALVDGTCALLTGNPCDDGNGCTQNDTCQAGFCVGANPVVCAVPDQCHTAGMCDPATGVCSNPSATDGTSCNDGNALTKNDVCTAGACAGLPLCTGVVCTASDQCHVAGTCDPTTGICSNPNAADSTPCNDGNAQTKNDVCTAGVCAGVPLCSGVVCSASDQCHVAGTCDPATGQCSSPNASDGTSCDDGNPNTAGDVCTAGLCAGINHCIGVICTAKDQCHDAGTCDHATGVCDNPVKSDGTTCDDGNALTKNDVCTSGACAGVPLCTGVVCMASDQCHDTGTCDPSTGVCSNPPKADGSACDDSDANTVGDVCSAGVCAGVDHCVGVICVPQDQCHVAGTCIDHATGACDSPAKPDNTACNDGDANTVGDVCTAGVCAGVDHCIGVTCTALDECHDTGTCVDHATGACDNPAKADGTSCSLGTCQQGTCTASPDGGMGGSGGAGTGGSGGAGTGGTSSSSSSSSGGSGGGNTSSSSGGVFATGGCDCRTAVGETDDGRGWVGALGLALVLARRRRTAVAARRSRWRNAEPHSDA
jgi:MYXO-CTERM domain-containing protein